MTQRRPKPWAETNRQGRTRYVWRFEGQKYWTNFYDDPEEARADATTQITEQLEGSWHERSGRTGSTCGGGCPATSSPPPAPSTSTSSKPSSCRNSKGARSGLSSSTRSRPGTAASPPASAREAGLTPGLWPTPRAPC